jgi:hypothetical protein
MSEWHDKPPTYREWRDANNHGCWWVKFILSKEHTEEIDGEMVSWPEAWYTEVVTIAVGYGKGGFKHLIQEIKGEEPDYSHITLHARGHVLKSLDLSDPSQVKDMYWQPVASPVDDVKDQRPGV